MNTKYSAKQMGFNLYPTRVGILYFSTRLMIKMNVI